MNYTKLPPIMRELLEPRRRSPLDPRPAIERLDRELEARETIEETAKEADRVFPTVTKAYRSGMPETPNDGSRPPLLVVRFPVTVEDTAEWSRQCKAWRARAQLR